jgi:hypothetical protein
MARTALTQLQEQIEAVRREAFAAGYAAAMQAIRDFTAKPAAGSEPSAPASRRGRRPAAPAEPARAPRPARGRRPRATAAAPAAAPRRGRSQRPQRGTNARLVEEVLQSNSPRALHPAEIRTALQRDKGVSMAFTSIRHALGQLEGRHSAEQVADSRTWRYAGTAGAETTAR